MACHRFYHKYQQRAYDRFDRRERLLDSEPKHRAIHRRRRRSLTMCLRVDKRISPSPFRLTTRDTD